MPSWDERYGADGYVYGTAPSRWLVVQAHRLPAGGRILSLGEGEGRNAVWLAQRGFSVVAVDGSAVGLAKAGRLAAARGVAVETVHADLTRYRPEPGAFDALLLAYVHLPPPEREQVHAAGAVALRAGGLVVLEAFTPRQLAFASGGPRSAELLYEPAALRADFPGIAWEVLEESELVLDDGPLHQGRAAIVRGVGRRAR